MSEGIQTIYGTAGLSTPEKQAWLPQAFDVLDKYGVTKLDTAQLYPNSEETIGRNSGATRFTIDTKWQGGFKKAEEPNEIPLDVIRGSLERLKTDSVDVWYIHSPPDTDMEEYLSSINEAHKAGLFKRFGLSNFKAEDVKKIYTICKENGWVLPEVYQGNYSAVARKQETVLFPTLRELGISFYAYSPLAGGFLTKTKEEVQAGAGRFGSGGMYAKLYSKPTYLEALAEWDGIAKKVGISRAELAYRWVKFNSPLDAKHGDGIIVGASRLEQLEQTLEGLKNGKLLDETVKAIDGIWEKISHEAPLDNFHY